MARIIAQAKATLSWPPAGGLAPDGFYKIAHNGGTYGAAVDTDSPLPQRIRPRPPDGRYTAGYGYGPYGLGGYGHGSAGVGYGNGPYGAGPYGRGTVTLQATTPPLDDGEYSFSVLAYDAAENVAVAGLAEADLALAGTPDPPADAEASAYDDGADTLTVEFTLSPDDSGA